MDQYTPEELRQRKANGYLKELVSLSQSMYEHSITLRAIAPNLDGLPDMKLSTVFIRTKAEHVISHLNELISNIEAGEISLDDFKSKKKTDNSSRLRIVQTGSVQDVGEGTPEAKCPVCGSTNLRDKGSFDKCMDCGKRIGPSDDEF